MDKLKFNIMSTGVTEILVNGRDLVELVNNKLGSYRHGHVEPRTLYYDLKCAEADRKYRYDAELGNCLECNVIGCDPLFCYVYKSKTAVKWVVGNSDEPKMLKFTFDRAEYETALQELRRLGADYGRETNTENIARDVQLYYSCEQFASLADFLYMRGFSDEAVAESRVSDKTCCFTGHRPKVFADFCEEGEDLPKGLAAWLDEKIDYVVREFGIRRFVCGNAEGVDTWAAKAVLKYKETHPDIHLEIAVPFEGHNDHIPEIMEIQRQADEVRVISQGKSRKEAYYRRNEYMVEKSDVVLGACVFYINNAEGIKYIQKGGTRRTIEYALRLGKKVYAKDYKKRF